MRCGGEAELPRLVQSAGLLDQVQADAARLSLAGHQLGRVADGVAEPGDPLQAFVGGGHEVVDVGGLEVDGDGAETAHGIHKVPCVHARSAGGIAMRGFNLKQTGPTVCVPGEGNAG